MDIPGYPAEAAKAIRAHEALVRATMGGPEPESPTDKLMRETLQMVDATLGGPIPESATDKAIREAQRMLSASWGEPLPESATDRARREAKETLEKSLGGPNMTDYVRQAMTDYDKPWGRLGITEDTWRVINDRPPQSLIESLSALPASEIKALQQVAGTLSIAEEMERWQRLSGPGAAMRAEVAKVESTQRPVAVESVAEQVHREMERTAAEAPDSPTIVTSMHREVLFSRKRSPPPRDHSLELLELQRRLTVAQEGAIADSRQRELQTAKESAINRRLAVLGLLLAAATGAASVLPGFMAWLAS